MIFREKFLLTEERVAQLREEQGLIVTKTRILKGYVGNPEKVVVPSDVRHIGIGAFEDCQSLKEVHIPAMRQIRGRAFKDCSNLEKVEFLSPSVYDIFAYAFQNCSSLKSFKFPQFLLFLGLHAFDGCSSLEELIIPYDTSILSGTPESRPEKETRITITNRYPIEGCPKLKKLVLPVWCCLDDEIDRGSDPDEEGGNPS